MGRPAKPVGERARDVVPTGVRLPPALRDSLAREAHVNSRSLSAEILSRLHASFDTRLPLTTAADRVRYLEAREPATTPIVALALGEPQRRLLSIYNRITPEEQLALLTLLGRLSR